MRSKVARLLAALLVLALAGFGVLNLWCCAPPVDAFWADAAVLRTSTDDTESIGFFPRETTIGFAALWVASLLVAGVIGSRLARRHVKASDS